MLEEVPADLLLQDFGLSITAGAVSGIGILDRNSEIILGGQAVIVDYMVTCRTDQFGALQYGSGIAVDGISYTVRHEPLKLADGRYCSIPLERLEIQNGTVPPAVIGGPSLNIPETVVIPEPRVGDDWPIFLTDYNITLTEVRCLVSGTGSPSVTMQVVYDPLLNAVGTAATAELVVNDLDDGQLATIVNQPIPANNQVRVKISATTGTVKYVVIYPKASIAVP